MDFIKEDFIRRLLTKQELKKLLPGLQEYLYDIPVLLGKKGKQAPEDSLFAMFGDKSDYKVRRKDPEIFIAKFHQYPKGMLVATLAHEYAHYIQVKEYNNWTHDEEWAKLFLEICPRKFLKYDENIKQEYIDRFYKKK